MKFMIIVKATADADAKAAAGGFPPGAQAMFQCMAVYHEELARAGVLLDAAGLQPSGKGWKIRYEDAKRQVIDGPFTDSSDVVTGYTLIQVRSRAEALEWSRRFPNPVGEGEAAEIEVRQLYETGDPEPFATAEARDRFKQMGMG